MSKTKANKVSINDFIIDGKPTQLCWDYISNLAKVVISKYFYKYTDYFDKDDLTSLAISDAVAFTIKVAENNNSGCNVIKNVRNVLFTRIRNTLSNFIFRSNKLVNTEDEILDLNTVYPKSYDIKHDLVSLNDLNIDSIDSFRTVSLNVWKLFKTNGANNNTYFINDNNDDISDWKEYSKARNMKRPCDLINAYNNYSDEQIEMLADKLDSSTGQNYFSTLYQLLGDKFLAFMDVFQEDKFIIPSTVLVKHLLTNISIYKDYQDGMSIEELNNKYNRSQESLKKIIASQEAI